MRTPEQERDETRLRRRIERLRLTSVMNDTKWGRLLELLEDFYPCGMRRKDVGEDAPPPDRDDSDIYHMLGRWEHIEWIELDAVSVTPRGALIKPEVHDRNDELRAALLAASIPFSVENGKTRIWGYLAPGASPNWAAA